MERIEHPRWKPLLVLVSTAIATFLVFHFNIPYGFLFVVTCFVLLQVFMHELYLKSLERIIGPVIASLFSVLLVYLAGPLWMISVFGCILMVSICMYLYAQRVYEYSMLLAGLTSALIVSFYYFMGPRAAYQLAIYWPLNILLGSLLVVILAFMIRAKVQFNFHEPQHQTPKIGYWFSHFNRYSSLIALRIVISLAAIILINGWLKQPSIAIQSLIAGVVVSAQLDLALTHHRVFFRVMGIIMGCLVGVVYGHFMTHFNLPDLMLVLIPLTLMLFSWLSQKLPVQLEYFFLQAGVMIPLILFDTVPGELYNSSIGIHRALGSIEGGLVALLVVYLFHIFCWSA